MEMTAVCLGSSQKPRASHIPTASATTWNSLFLQARLTSTSTKSVTHLPVPSVTDMPVRTTKPKHVFQAACLFKGYPLNLKFHKIR